MTADMETRHKLEQERNYDLLTGIYNRRAFRELVEMILHKQKMGIEMCIRDRC